MRVYTEPTDMRKSFNTLSALVTEEMGREVLSGDLFLFLSRDRKRAKVLHFDGTGLIVWAKRLERGRFAPLYRKKQQGGLELSPVRCWRTLDERPVVPLPLEDPDRAGEISARIDELFENSTAPTKTETERAFQTGFVTMWGNVGALVQAIGTAADASVVMLELKQSLDVMTESMKSRNSSRTCSSSISSPSSSTGTV